MYRPSELRQKLDHKAETMTHVGYSLRSKGYPVKRDIVVRRDVIFDESTSPVALGEKSNSGIIVDVDTQLQTTNIEPRRSTRSTNEPFRYGIHDFTGPGHATNYVADNIIIEPKSMSEAQASPQSQEWQKAVDIEY